MEKYAPEYSSKEKIHFVVKTMAWFTAILLVSKYWLYDWIAEYSIHAHCHYYGDINGVHLLFYGIYTIIPLSIAVLLFFLEGRKSIQIIKLSQYPLPNQKVFKKTKYIYGYKAKITPFFIILITVSLFALSIWGAFQAFSLTQAIPTCELGQ